MAPLAALTMIALATLLIVDDEPAIPRGLARLLRSEPYRVLVASSGEEALALMAREKVDILVSDIDMPRMSGLDLMADVRHRHPDVVRILLTGRGTMPAVMDALNRAEAFRFLLKPCDVGELKAVLAEACRRLDELRRTAHAAESAERRARLIEELERAHPGLTRVELVDGAYSLSGERLTELSDRAARKGLRFLDPVATTQVS